MGNGLSPWLLCLALDPLMFQLAHKVSAASSAYMDDVTVPWANVQQLALAQSIITQFGRVSGLTVAPHRCFRAACWETSRWFRFRLRVRSATGPALHAAARILSPKAGVVRSFPIRARKDLRKVLRAMVALPLPPANAPLSKLPFSTDTLSLGSKRIYTGRPGARLMFTHSPSCLVIPSHPNMNEPSRGNGPPGKTGLKCWPRSRNGPCSLQPPGTPTWPESACGTRTAFRACNT